MLSYKTHNLYKPYFLESLIPGLYNSGHYQTRVTQHLAPESLRHWACVLCTPVVAPPVPVCLVPTRYSGHLLLGAPTSSQTSNAHHPHSTTHTVDECPPRQLVHREREKESEGESSRSSCFLTTPRNGPPWRRGRGLMQRHRGAANKETTLFYGSSPRGIIFILCSPSREHTVPLILIQYTS